MSFSRSNGLYSKYVNDKSAMDTRLLIWIQALASILIIAAIQLLFQQKLIPKEIVGYILPISPVASPLIGYLMIYVFRQKIALKRCTSDFKLLKEKVEEAIKAAEIELDSIKNEDDQAPLIEVIKNLKKKKAEYLLHEVDEIEKIVKAS